MAWERKGRGPAGGYYYLSVRVPDMPHPVRVYFGRGALGQMAAAEADERKSERQRDRDALWAERKAIAEAERLATELREWAGILSASWLVMTNHHKHRGVWRHQRGQEF